MANLPFDPSAFNRAPVSLIGGGYDGGEYSSAPEIELSELPRSRAPSYVSNSSFWNGDANDDDSLLKHGRSQSYTQVPKDDVSIQVVSQTPTMKSNREKRRKLQGWKFGVACSAWVAFTVLVLNTVLTIYAAIQYDIQGGVGTALDGNCKEVNEWTTWLHILINALSSVLLSASNYTMQCLCSPTRKEIDQAHARGDWLDIGVASVRNIFKIRWSRRVLWWILALSSVPIHLLYNSAVFKTLAANDYTVLVVNEDFLKGQPFASEYMENPDRTQLFPDQLDNAIGLQTQFANATGNGTTDVQEPMVKLSNSDCIAAYGTSFVSDYESVLAVTSSRGQSTNATMLWYNSVSHTPDGWGGDPVSYLWICEDNYTVGIFDACDVGKKRKHADNWRLDLYDIDYCLAIKTEPHCKLQFSIHILMVVILMNLGKCATMFLTLYRQKDATIVTVGDALTHFLDRPDELTKGRCLMSKVDVDAGPLRWRLRIAKDRPNTEPLPITYYRPMRRRWFAAASLRRWLVTMGLCVVALITSSVLLAEGMANTASYLNGEISPLALGFGAVDSRSIISADLPQGGAGGLVSAVLLANCPQAIVSFLYLTYNGLFTSMLLGHEYSKYGVLDRRKPLRVTTPRGQQRSTYYLHLPYTYSIPLIIASGTLHWLISQSIFLVRVSVFDEGRSEAADNYSEVGYSCLPILLTILLGTAMLLVAIGHGFRRFASHIPVAGSCSVAIAAAAHRPKSDEDAAYLPVQWGEVNGEGTDEVGHCCFTSEEVREMVEGKMYAGVAGASGMDHRVLGQARERSLLHSDDDR